MVYLHVCICSFLSNVEHVVGVAIVVDVAVVVTDAVADVDVAEAIASDVGVIQISQVS